MMYGARGLPSYLHSTIANFFLFDIKCTREVFIYTSLAVPCNRNSFHYYGLHSDDE